MKSRKRVSIERRVFSHLKIPLSINFSFMSPWKSKKAIKIIKGKAWDVSTAGLCLETAINMKDGVLEFSETEAREKVKVLPYLVLSEKEIKLELKLPPGKQGIVMTGEPIWYELASEGSISRLRVGVLFTGMPKEGQDKWAHYIRYSDLRKAGNHE